MSDPATRPTLHAVLRDDIVADGDVEQPSAGAVLHDLALRLVPARAGAPGTPEVVLGVVEWVRYDEANGLFEAAVDAGSFHFLTQVVGPGPGWSRGLSVRLEGVLESVGPYEFEAFQLPDVRQDWSVTSSHKVAVGGDYVLEILPL